MKIKTTKEILNKLEEFSENFSNNWKNKNEFWKYENKKWVSVESLIFYLETLVDNMDDELDVRQHIKKLKGETL